MKMTINIELNNDAYHIEEGSSEIEVSNIAASGSEIARQLRKLADDIEHSSIHVYDLFTVRDINGNTTLMAEVKED